MGGGGGKREGRGRGRGGQGRIEGGGVGGKLKVISLSM